MTKFLEDRYLDTVSLLKEINLWDLDTGMILLPIIQYCMPPPSTKEIIKLLKYLTDNKINTNWAPLLKVEKTYRKLQGKPTIEKGDPDSYGTNYPIHLGIHKIASQKNWSDEDRSYLIDHFVTKVFETTAIQEWLNTNEYYSNVYYLRDVLITDYAQQNDLIVIGRFDANLDYKRQKTEQLLSKEKLLGVHGECIAFNPENTFWQNPPATKFTLSLEFLNNQTQKGDADPHRHETLGPEPEPTAEELLLVTEQQLQASYYSQPKWVRQNVRSLADANQLSWSTVFSYWEHLLKADKMEVFKLSLLVFLTGIQKSRWVNATYNIEEKITFNNLNIIEPNTLIIRVNKGATIFTDSNDYAKDYIILNMPKGLRISEDTISKGLKEEYMVRSFSKTCAGPTPLLNNIARSSHTLFRKNIAGELQAFILTGNIPIEFKARNAYYRTSNSEVNSFFQQCLVVVKQEFKKTAHRYPLVKKELEGIIFSKAPILFEHQIGSQLANVSWDFRSFSIPTDRNTKLAQQLALLNQLELYYFWILEYGYATRPIGKETEHYLNSGLVLHRDKDSSDYLEAKLLLENDLIKAQKNELDGCRKAVEENCDQLKIATSLDHFYPLLHTFIKDSNTLESSPLLSKAATKLTKKLWGLSPVLDRNNAHRHQCASYIHRELDETYADAWLGHHIDGWYFASPQSSATITTLNQVSEVQSSWLENLGFRLIRNPLA